MPLPRNVRITLSPKQAVAMLYVAQVGDARLRATGEGIGGHKARNGALRILERAIEHERALLREKQSPAAPGASQ